MNFYFRKLDWGLIVSALLLSGVGLFAIYGTGNKEMMYFFNKQMIFLVIGAFLMIFLSLFDYRIFKNSSLPLVLLYIFSLVGLLFVLSSDSIRGASSWLKIGPLTIEPVEIIKIVIILFLAKYFSLRHIEMYRARHLIVSGFYIAVPCLLLLLQPDLGSAMAVASIWIGIIIISGIKVKHLFVLSLVALIALAGGWATFLEDYQKQRILTFMNPREDPFGGGYHIAQSLIAVGSGGVLGQESDEGSQAGLKFLPEQHTDFIFANFAEQTGTLGVGILLTLYIFLIWRIIKIALSATNNFARLYSIGLVSLIFFQVVVNIGMNVGLMPITGITLPLVSYGGSSLLSFFIAFGIIQSIQVRS